MKRPIIVLVLSVGFLVLASGCATKKFVREQVGATETKITQRVDTQEMQLRDTTDKTGKNTQAIDAAGQRLQTLDSRVGEVGTIANDAKTGAGDAKQQAESVGNSLRETRTEFTQRWANRNQYSPLETISVFFDFNRADLKDQGMSELEEVAKALKANPNAVLELQGFADPTGADRYNYQLTRDRVDSVVRYLVQRHGIDLRRIYAVGMGKEVRTAGEKATREANSKSRRVDIRLLAPQS
jgi:outer membrane protein OmpA-like peptidoglycan-associated protein